MENLPKLLPLWHGQTNQDTSKKNRRFLEDRLPDFGGIGIDITLKENDFTHSIAKNAVDQVGFTAQICALPFLPANKVTMKIDPCLSFLDASKENFKKFCLKLQNLRTHVNSVRYKKCREEILSAHIKVKEMCKTGNYTDICLPESVIELANIIPETVEIPKANLNYSGGCLASSKMSDKNHILLYPTGKELNKLTLITLEQSCEPNVAFKPSDSKKCSIKLKNGPIQQIKSGINGYSYVRQDKHTSFVNFCNMSDVSVTNCSTPDTVINIGASPYCPEEFISLHENGMVELNNSSFKKVLWSIRSHTDFDVFIDQTPLICSFGQHPRSVLCLSEKKLQSFDARLEERKESVIFSFDSFMDEYLTCMRSPLVNSFQHIISSTVHLFVCDERYPRKPVLQFNHLLKGYPLYCDISSYNSTPNSSDVVVLLGTQKSQELISFFLRSGNSLVDQPVSLSPPLLLSAPTDCVKSLKFHCVNIDNDVMERLSYPLVGVTAVPQSNKSAFTAFQLTSLGDLYYQDFRTDLNATAENAERTYRVDMGCVLTPPDKTLPSINNWSEKLKKDKTRSIITDFNRIDVDLMDILNKQAEPSTTCSVCKSNDPVQSQEIVSSDVCPACGLEDSQGEILLKAFDEMIFLAGHASEDCDLSQFDPSLFFQFDDPYSKKILKPWTTVDSTQTDDIAEPLWDYSSGDDWEISSLSSSKSLVNVSSPIGNFKSVLESSIPEDAASQVHSQGMMSSMDETNNDTSLYQEPSEDVIPPSQDIRPVIGETLRTPKRTKIQRSKNDSSFAGF